MIKILLAFTVGVFAGGVGTYLVMRKKCEEEIEYESEELRQYYKRKYGSEETEEPDDQNDFKEVSDEPSDRVGDAIVDAIREYASSEDADEFETRMAESEYPEDDEEMMLAEGINSDKNGTCIISDDEFESYPYNDKIELVYYTDDNILSEEDGEVVTDREMLIGDFIDTTNFFKNDEEYLHVRNGKISTDFEIKKVFGSYYDYYDHP